MYFMSASPLKAAQDVGFHLHSIILNGIYVLVHAVAMGEKKNRHQGNTTNLLLSNYCTYTFPVCAVNFHAL